MIISVDIVNHCCLWIGHGMGKVDNDGYSDNDNNDDYVYDLAHLPLLSEGQAWHG